MPEDTVLHAQRAHTSFTTLYPRGEWPSEVSDLPIFLTQAQLAHLRGVTVRTLQRDRRLGRSIPFAKMGKKVLYARADVLAHLRDPIYDDGPRQT